MLETTEITPEEDERLTFEKRQEEAEQAERSEREDFGEDDEFPPTQPL